VRSFRCTYHTGSYSISGCRVVRSFILFLYTRLVYDIGSKSLQDVSQEDLLHPVMFTFNLVELFRLADFFRVTELLNIFCQNFFCPAVMFSPTCGDPLEQEHILASIIMKFSHTESQGFMRTLAKTYNQGTGGLSCLCKWPTMYSR
jgi:hypothetical protein